MINKEKLCEELTVYIKRNLKYARKNTETILDKFNIPTTISTDYLTLREDVGSAEDFILFALLDTFDPKKEHEYFSDQEIQDYLKVKYEIRHVKFPLNFKCLRVRDNQWIGTITAKELMALRDAQLINYNENTQRTMVRRMYGSTEVYSIALNKKAVRDISEAMERDFFVPNTLTFNLPEGAQFYYDENNHKLIVESAKHFDIIDGYHRYIAISQIYNSDRNFDYPMEIRIVNFSESEANQFIYQEAQKTKMPKIDSDSMNQHNVANRIVNKLNSDQDCDLFGQISRNKGLIRSGYLAEAIDMIYCCDIKKSEEAIKVKEIETELCGKFNILVETERGLLERSWSRILTICAVFVFSKENITKDEMVRHIMELYAIVASEGNEKIIGTKLLKTHLTRLNKLLEGEILA